MDCPAGEHWSVHLDRCDYPSLARCKLDGSYQFKVKKSKPMQASEQVDEEEDDKPETEDFEIDPRCEGSDPLKPMHYKHVSDCTKVCTDATNLLVLVHDKVLMIIQT
jgi:hypothetical protein